MIWNECNGVSHRWQLNCFYYIFYRLTTKETIAGTLWGGSTQNQCTPRTKRQWRRKRVPWSRSRIKNIVWNEIGRKDENPWYSLAKWDYAPLINEHFYFNRVTKELLFKSLHMFLIPPLVNRCRVCQYIFHNHIIIDILLVNRFDNICCNLVRIITSAKRRETIIWNNTQ